MISESLEINQLPKWLKRPIGNSSQLATVQRIIKVHQIHTICEEGRCPNRAEFYWAIFVLVLVLFVKFLKVLPRSPLTLMNQPK